MCLFQLPASVSVCHSWDEWHFPIFDHFICPEGSEQPGSKREEKENGGIGNPSVPGHTGPILCNGE